MASIEASARRRGGVAAWLAAVRRDVSQNCAKYPILAKSKKVIAMTMREDALGSGFPGTRAWGTRDQKRLFPRAPGTRSKWGPKGPILT